jgi:hypothetical protein
MEAVLVETRKCQVNAKPKINVCRLRDAKICAIAFYHATYFCKFLYMKNVEDLKEIRNTNFKFVLGIF